MRVPTKWSGRTGRLAKALIVSRAFVFKRIPKRWCRNRKYLVSCTQSIGGDSARALYALSACVAGGPMSSFVGFFAVGFGANQLSSGNGPYLYLSGSGRYVQSTNTSRLAAGAIQELIPVQSSRSCGETQAELITHGSPRPRNTHQHPVAAS